MNMALICTVRIAYGMPRPPHMPPQMLFLTTADFLLQFVATSIPMNDRTLYLMGRWNPRSM
jgi:hypothetical protein